MEHKWNELFIYEPSSPTFLINKVHRSIKARAGAIAGCVGDKEIKTKVNKVAYRNARIIWEMHNKPLKKNQIMKFKDGNEFNLLLENLDVQTRREKGVSSNQPLGKSGIRGVNKVGDKWLAYAKVKGKSLFLGSYNSPEDAIVGRKTALKMVK